ncbi:PolC-type DNA polymerase III [Proteinivorax hydrogeniformans]|uniref:DNA polymerase III PolC-type n=1 Tax=Proteinivorax hydrogeniformans TaxID=1826727 RepID=A0AAU8HQG3_9FIRM
MEAKKFLSKQSLKINKISVSTHHNRWVVYISELNYCEDSFKELKKQLSLVVPDVKIGVCIQGNFKASNLSNLIRMNEKYILERIETDFPAFKSSTQNWKIDVDGILVKLSIPNKIHYFCAQQNGLAAWLEKFIRKHIQCEAKVSITLNQQLLQQKSKVSNTHKKEEEDYIKTLEKKIKDNKKQESKEITGQTSHVIVGKQITKQPINISTIIEEDKNISVAGMIFNMEYIEFRTGRTLLSFDITDNTDSITCKYFLESGQQRPSLNKGDYVKVFGYVQPDRYSQELTFFPNSINAFTPTVKMDDAEDKRVELHAHTKMSTMDATVTVKDLIKRAAKWDHKAIAITDHGVVQSFPDAAQAGQDNDIKVIYGVETYLVEDEENEVFFGDKTKLNDDNYEKLSYVVFDFETTGLNNKTDEIIEIGAAKIENGNIIETFTSFIKPSKDIPRKITEITGITNENVDGAPTLDKVLPQFKDFCGDSILVAHNAKFDLGFLDSACKKQGINFNYLALDTLNLSRLLTSGVKDYKLNTLADHYNISLQNHHRAEDDCKATALLLLELFKESKELGFNSLKSLSLIPSDKKLKNKKAFHCILLVKNYEGLKNLYKLISIAHTKLFYKKPKLSKALIKNLSNGLIIGSACEAGEIFQMYLNNEEESYIEEVAKFYDYLEVQPINNNRFLIDKDIVNSELEIQQINKKIISLAEKLDKPVVATGDVHFLDEHDSVYREILMTGQGFSDADRQPPLYFKTTEEMLSDFSYLPKELQKKIVIENPQKINDMIEDIKPIPDGLFTPKIENADSEIKRMCKEKSEELYGNPVPPLVAKRLEKELGSIIKHGFGVIYYISHKLVAKSLSDGYLVGSRGSVGSSLVATFTDITEVNPLPPHYRCPKCKYSEFIEDGSVGTGVDLPDKECPKCNTNLVKDGHDIPFEVFLGFDGDKVPDIDLNFSGEYQGIAHKYTEELFGTGYVFKAGTISTIAEKTAYGFVKNYLSDKELIKRTSETNRLVSGCSGVKRTTGQHPGGLMVVPNDKSIFDFCPVQHPADDKKSNTITTHFDYNAISSRLLKLDILGHDDPTVIKLLEDLTGVNAQKIPLDDPKTMSLFSSTEALGIDSKDLGSEVGSMGIPEFGTSFVRQMLVDTKPNTLSELFRISGLSHGTDVWLNNAQDIVKNNIAPLSQVISTRDDIMTYLLHKGLEPSMAFQIMESVRKGKGLTDEFLTAMKKHEVPQWYIDSCKKIKYMFPKAHAVAYVTMAFRIAYFKVHHPLAFYCAYFSVRATDFDVTLVQGGLPSIKSKLKELKGLGNNVTAKEKSVLTMLEICLEMYLRGFKFLPVDIYKSDDSRFIIDGNALLPPLVSVPSLGLNAARTVVSARKLGEFLSIEDIKKRTKLSKTVIATLKEMGCLDGLPDTNQLSLF